ncbi:mCG1051042 [Mus musculus]|nr:mCG1051042 [Mus musculus]
MNRTGRDKRQVHPRMTSRPLCFQMMVGGRELTTSQTITASSPSLNSCGVGAFLNMSFSER